MIRLYTDGSYSPEDHVGAWSWVLVGDVLETEFVVDADAGVIFADTTPQRVEIEAVLQGLRALPDDIGVLVLCDSANIVQAMSEHLWAYWATHKWYGASYHAISYPELWEQLVAEAERVGADFEWVHAHNGMQGDPWNIEADHLARDTRKTAQLLQQSLQSLE